MVELQAILSQASLVKNFFLGQLAFADLFMNEHAYTSALVLYIVLMLAVFVVGMVMNDHSQVDRLWSFLPFLTVLYFWFHAYMHNSSSPRLSLAALVIMIWAVRLTHNFARKSGYSGVEDYRWAILRANMSKFQFFIFSIVFIAVIQLLLLLNIAAPSIVFLESNNVSLSILDVLFVITTLILIIIEGITDNEMWRYQCAKAIYRESSKATGGYTTQQLSRGFCTTGPFKYSRHANFLCEQLIWILFYAWPSVISGNYINWTIIGPLCYTLLFQGSTTFTERITLSKYPTYHQYQASVGRFFPNFRSHWVEPKST
ncbi:hypothetical protein V1511DRAFT_321730 [Dipodascopsis uninucleata]